MPAVATIRVFLALVALAALLAACGDEDEQPTATAPGGSDGPTPTATVTAGEEQLALDETKWLLAAINGADIDLQTPITLSFSDGQAVGFSGCNEYGGAYTAELDGSFSIPELIQTDMACEGTMDLEADYLSALGEAAHYGVVDGVRLELANSDGETTLVFSRDDRQALDGTAWVIVEIDGEAPLAEPAPTLELRAGEASGSTGCNEFGGMYTATDEGQISFSELFWTERGCPGPPGVMEQEQAFLEVLSEASGYRFGLGNDTLEIINAEGQARIIVANREEAIGTGLFNGTAWVLASLNGRDVASRPPVTIHFVSSQFAGTAGCVGYNGAIETEPNGVITYLAADSYAPPCDDPAEQSDLPGEYLAALDTAAQFRLSSDMLEILDDEGSVVLTYRPAVTDSQLESTSWELVSLNGAENIPGTLVTADFSDGYILGRGGCNEYGGPYIVSEPGAISIPPPVMTAMGCTEPPGVQEQETAFHEALGRVRTYQISDTELKLLDASGELQLAFERQPS